MKYLKYRLELYEEYKEKFESIKKDNTFPSPQPTPSDNKPTPSENKPTYPR